jgi:hypothetical protein
VFFGVVEVCAAFFGMVALDAHVILYHVPIIFRRPHTRACHYGDGVAGEDHIRLVAFDRIVFDLVMIGR